MSSGAGTTTNIHDLPVDPSGGGNNNVNLVVQETPSTQYSPQVPSVPPQASVAGPPPSQPSQGPPQQPVPSEGAIVDQGSINQLVQGLQQAYMTGATQLPSRDIPTTTEHISQDQEIQANFIPPVEKEMEDYLENQEDEDDIINQYNEKVSKASAMDKMYNELQTPILLAILFFLFQLPFFKKYLFLYLPVLFMNDGNYNLYGYLFISVFFAFVYYSLSKSVSMFNQF